MTHARQDVARRRSSRSGFGKWRRGLALSGLLLLLVLSWGCEDDTTLGLGVSCITFVPETDPTGGEVVAQRSSDSGCDVVVVELVVTGVDDVHSASFEIDFPDEISLISQDLDVTDSFLSDLEERDAGDDLEQFLDEVPPDSGIAVGGVTRQGPEAGVTPDDDNNILLKVAFFGFVNSGSGALSFIDADSNLQIRATEGDPPVAAVPAVPFRGGTLMIINEIP